MDKLLFRPEEAARLLGLGRTTVYELIAAGTLPCIRVGRSIRLRREEVIAWARGSAGATETAGDEPRE